MNRVFLADVAEMERTAVMDRSGQLQTVLCWEIDNAKLAEKRAESAADYPQMFVISSMPGQLMFHRFHLGVPKIEVARGLIWLMCGALQEVLREWDQYVSWLTLLRGGEPFVGRTALSAMLPRHQILPIPHVPLEVERHRENGSFIAVVNTSSKPYRCGRITCSGEGALASGVSMVAAIKHYRERCLIAGGNPRIERIVLFVAAGGLYGAKKIHAACRELGIQLTVVFSQAILGIVENAADSLSGEPLTDLPLLHPETITDRNTWTWGMQEFSGNQGICAIGDAGDALQRPECAILTSFNDWNRSGLDYRNAGLSILDLSRVYTELPWTRDFIPEEERAARTREMRAYIANYGR